jgi:hypothetical protein
MTSGRFAETFLLRYLVSLLASLLHHVGMTTDRQNTDLAAAIDQALHIQLELGSRAAATFLEEHGAGFALICRVLAEPERRRRPVESAVR